MGGDPRDLRRRYVDAGFTEPGQLVAQRARADAERFGGLAPVAVAGPQRIENQVALARTERGGERGRRSGGARTDLVGYIARELELDVLRADDRTVDQDDCPLHEVVELADVARPRISEQQVRRLRAQRRDRRPGAAAGGKELHG